MTTALAPTRTSHKLVLRRLSQAAIVGYLVTLAVSAERVLNGLYSNADAASGPVLGELGEGRIILGNYPWYPALWLERATRWLPDHVKVWESVGYALSIAAIVLVGLTVRRLAGSTAGWAVAALLICAPPALLRTQVPLTFRPLSWLGVCLIFFVFVAAASRADGRLARSPALHWLVVVAAGTYLGINIASDRLILVTAVVPLAIGLGLLYEHARDEARACVRTCGAIAAVSAVAGALTIAAAAHADLHPSDFRVHLGGLDRLHYNLTTFWNATLALWGGERFLGLGSPWIVHFACACVGLGITLLGTGYGLRSVWRLSRRELTLPPGEIAFVAFATWVIVLTMLAYVLTTAPDGPGSGRYLVGMRYASVALAAVAVLRANRVWARIVTVSAVVLVALAASYALLDNQIAANPEARPTKASTAGLERTLAASGVTGRGFAEYWDAAPLTLLSNFRLHVFPFQYCNGKPCPYFLHQASAWYRPGTTRSSFIVLRHGSTPAKAFGRPARFISAGPFRVFVYDYDVARRFAPLEVD